MKETLQTLEQILSKYDHSGQASIIRKVLLLDSTDASQSTKLLQSVDVWGGSGAVWEVYLADSRLSDREVAGDRRRFQDAIIRLADAMEAKDLGTARSRSIAKIFREWKSREYPGGTGFIRPPRGPDVEAEIEFVPTEEGGRRKPACSGYRPQHDFGLSEGHFDAMHKYVGHDWVFPGESTRAHLWFLSEDLIRGRISPGDSFTILEGARVVGRGRILRLLGGG